MCAINPARTATFELKLYTSNRHLTDAEWQQMVNEAALEAEMTLNKTGRIRAHVTEVQVQPTPEALAQGEAANDKRLEELGLLCDGCGGLKHEGDCVQVWKENWVK